jgi:hypothetical protein
MATIEARITGVTRKKEGSPWFTIKTDHDRIKTLETKYRERAEEAFSLQKSGEVAIIEFSSNPRTDEATGRTYPNNYFERAKTKIEEPQQTLDDIPTEESSSPSTRKTDPADAWRMSLAAGAKLAVATLPLLDEDQRDFTSQQELAFAWGTFLYTTPPGSQVAVGVGGGNGSAADFDDFPPPGDDDIPF